MNATKKDCVKNINLSIEKVLENFTEIVEHLRVQKASKLDEMKSLVFSKKRMCELTEAIEIIFQNLVQLKLIHRNFHLKYEKIVPENGFESLFKRLKEGFESVPDNDEESFESES